MAIEGLEFKRDELLKVLSPKEAALYRFIEHLWHLEESNASGEVPKSIVTWKDGRTSREIIEKVLDSKEGHNLPMPYAVNSGWREFGWTIAAEPDRTKYTGQAYFQRLAELNQQYPPKGFWDIRLFDRGNDLLFRANGVGFSNMQPEWDAAVGKIPYPIAVEDNGGFFYTNDAYQTRQLADQPQIRPETRKTPSIFNRLGRLGSWLPKRR